MKTFHIDQRIFFVCPNDAGGYAWNEGYVCSITHHRKTGEPTHYTLDGLPVNVRVHASRVFSSRPAAVEEALSLTYLCMADIDSQVNVLLKDLVQAQLVEGAASRGCCTTTPAGFTPPIEAAAKGIPVHFDDSNGPRHDPACGAGYPADPTEPFSATKCINLVTCRECTKVLDRRNLDLEGGNHVA